MDEARREQLAATAQHLTHLTKHDSWPTLKQMVRAKIERDAATLQTPAPSMDLRGFDFKRGFWAGMNYVINAAENAEQEYQKALRDAEQIEGKVT